MKQTCRTIIPNNGNRIINGLIKGLLLCLCILWFLPIYSLAKDDWYTDYEYDLLPASNVILLKKYIGTDVDLFVPSKAVIDGVSYTTMIRNGEYDTGSVWGADPANVRSISSTKSLSFEAGVLLPDNCNKLFSRCNSLENLDISRLDTTYVTSMNFMFEECEKLTNLDVSTLKTGSVTSMSGMFINCRALKKIDVSAFDTANVKSMGSMFENCSELKSLDISNFNTSKVTDMGLMFCGCIRLEKINLGKLDTSNVLYMQEMFEACIALQSLDLSSFVTYRVTDMNRMFFDCRTLEALDLSSFETYLVTNMLWMFSGCSNLKNLNVSNFDTRNVEKMQYMFSLCVSLKSLDLSSFSFAKANIFRIFSNAFDSGAELYLPEDFGKYDFRTDTFNECNAISIVHYAGTKAEWGALDSKIILYRDFAVYCSDGMYESPFDIEFMNISDPVDQVYTGSPIIPSITVRTDSEELKYQTDFSVQTEDNIGVGTATVTIRGIGNYHGMVVKTFRILKADMSKCKISDIPKQYYTGEPVEPYFNVTYSGNVVSSYSGYTYEYINNIKAGKATVKLTGNNNFSGTLAKTFVIEKPTSKIAYRGDTEIIDGRRKFGYIIKKGILKIPASMSVAGMKFKITTIPANEFKNKQNIKEIIIQKNVKTIGKNAFSGCKNTLNITVYANNLNSVGKNAFKNASKNTTITIIAKNKKTYNKVVKMIKKSGVKKAKFKYRKG